MRLTIIVIGDEILLGQVTDTNSGFIARTLGPMGWEVANTVVVPDSAPAIRSAIEEALADSDLIITTGGLGPTKDDITKQVLLGIFGGQMRLDTGTLANVERIFSLRGLPLNDLTRSQAMVPDSCRVITNELGTAPIMWFERDGKVLVALPGVPFEMRGMLTRSVAPMIKEAFDPQTAIMHHTMIARGISESALAERLAAFEEALPTPVHLAYLPTPGYVRLRLDGSCPAAEAQAFAAEFEGIAAELRQQLGQLLLHDGDATPAQILLQKAREKGLTIATAESCTGGNIAHSITSEAGCSDCYVGSVVSYANSAKEQLLGVPAEMIAEHGAVSRQVALAMAAGACRATGASCAVSTTGIAGPTGAAPGKPVGTVWIGVHTPGGSSATLLHLPGDRARVIDRATTEALLLLAQAL